MALAPQQAARIAIGFARRGAWQAFWAPNEVEAYAKAVVIPLPVRFIETKQWTEHSSTDIQYLAGAEALSMPQSELPAPPPHSSAIHTTIAHLGEPVGCPVCAGVGKTSCSSCSGRGRKACPRCSKAPGYKPKCPTCNGYSFADKPCRTCKGTGHEDPCHECNGERLAKCLPCAGLGNGDCPRCRGTGKAFKCRILTKTYEARRGLEWMPSLPNDVATWLDGRIPCIAEQPVTFEDVPPTRTLAGARNTYEGNFHLGHYKRNLNAYFLEANGDYLKINEQVARRIGNAYGMA
jgi:hypothetical protein